MRCEVRVFQQLKEDLEVDMVRQFEELTVLGGPPGFGQDTWRGHADIGGTDRVDLRRTHGHQRVGRTHKEGTMELIPNEAHSDPPGAGVSPPCLFRFATLNSDSPCRSRTPRATRQYASSPDRGYWTPMDPSLSTWADSTRASSSPRGCSRM
jgi:hypothetical protein